MRTHAVLGLVGRNVSSSTGMDEVHDVGLPRLHTSLGTCAGGRRVGKHVLSSADKEAAHDLVLVSRAAVRCSLTSRLLGATGGLTTLTAPHCCWSRNGIPNCTSLLPPAGVALTCATALTCAGGRLHPHPQGPEPAAGAPRLERWSCRVGTAVRAVVVQQHVLRTAWDQERSQLLWF